MAHEMHGGSKTPEYRVWAAMIGRCHNPSDKSYFNYGARGITVCDSWRRSFAAFIADVGYRPHRHLTLERRDNNRGYSPDNCHWATRAVQALNCRVRKDSPFGIPGVTFNQRDRVFASTIRRDSKVQHLGTTRDFFEACCLRKSAEVKFRCPQPAN